MIVIADSYSYIDLAKSLFEQGGFFHPSGNLQIRRTPGYPLLIASTYFFFGSGELLPTIIIQQFVFFMTVMVSAYLAFQLAGRVGVVITTVLLSLDFTTFYFVNTIHTETWFTLLTVLTVLFLYNGFRSPNKLLAWWLMASFSLSIATFIRPSSLYLFYAIALLAIAYYVNQHRTLKEATTIAVTIFLPWILVIGSWYLRNYLATGALFFTTIQGELFFVRTSSMMATKLGIPITEAIQYLPENLKTGGTSPLLHLQFYIENIGLYIRESFLSVGRTLFSPGQELLQTYFTTVFRELVALEKPLLNGDFTFIFNELAKRPFAYLPLVILVLFHSALSFFGLIVSFFYARSLSRQNKSLYLSALLFIAYFIFIVVVFVGSSRFRVPISPLIAILAGYGFNELFMRKSHQPSGA